MKYILATNNINKLNEIKPLINKDIKILTLKDLNYNKDIIEDGETFKENAFIKAKTLYDEFKIKVISDDSGLLVKSLNNEPGINSKRYSNKGDYENNVKLLNNLKDIKDRSAKFVTVICLYDGNEPIFFKGEMKGSISYELKGRSGFGYDPLFIPEGYNKTISELGPEIKEKISHRSSAIKKLIDYISNE